MLSSILLPSLSSSDDSAAEEEIESSNDESEAELDDERLSSKVISLTALPPLAGHVV